MNFRLQCLPTLALRFVLEGNAMACNGAISFCTSFKALWPFGRSLDAYKVLWTCYLGEQIRYGLSDFFLYYILFEKMVCDSIIILSPLRGSSGRGNDGENKPWDCSRNSKSFNWSFFQKKNYKDHIKQSRMPYQHTMPRKWLNDFH